MLKEKIEEIKERLSLSNKELSHLLEIKMESLINCEKEVSEKIIEIFNITLEDLKGINKLPKLKITKILDMKKYKNKVVAYNEIIKSHHTASWKIYVLTKTKVKEKIKLTSLFKKRKKVELKEFTPSFLAVNNNTLLLINFTDGKLIITELDNDINTDEFVEDNTKYRKANEVKIP